MTLFQNLTIVFQSTLQPVFMLSINDSKLAIIWPIHHREYASEASPLRRTQSAQRSPRPWAEIIFVAPSYSSRVVLRAFQTLPRSPSLPPVYRQASSQSNTWSPAKASFRRSPARLWNLSFFRFRHDIIPCSFLPATSPKNVAFISFRSTETSLPANTVSQLLHSLFCLEVTEKGLSYVCIFRSYQCLLWAL